MKKIWNWFVGFPKDKLQHQKAIAIIASVSILILRCVGVEELTSCAYGWGIAFVFGIGKEIIDEVRKKSSEASDWAADVIADTLVVLYSYIIMVL